LKRTVIVSFLGTGDYQETEYRFGESGIKTRFFPHAAKHFFPEADLFVIMTQKAFDTHHEALEKICKYQTISIPDGKTETEMWEIFSAMTEMVPVNPGDELILDVTHGFRSQPMLALAALSFIKAMKEVSVKHIIYGAFEAKTGDVTPVFDLLPFLDIIEWSVGVTNYKSYGDMKMIGEKLKFIHRQTYIEHAREKSRALSAVGETLSRLSRSLETVRVAESMQYASRFVDEFKGLSSDFENHPKTKPFSLLMQSMQEKIKPIAVPGSEIFSEGGLSAQKQMIEHYINSGQYQQAATLMREYVVSVFMKRGNNGLTRPDFLDEKKRGDAEESLGDLMKKSVNKEEMKNEESFFGKIWVRLSQIRNDLNHGSMRPDPIKGEDIAKNIIKAFEEIRENL